MTAYKGANVTKYDVGGGDNYISDGYIKTVEKVWIDYLAFTSVLTTADSVLIAKVPANKKITGVEVFFPSITPTTSTINVGTAGDDDLFIDDHATVGLNVARMNVAGGFGYVTTAQTSVYLKIGTIAMTAPTAGTIYTIVRYT